MNITVNANNVIRKWPRVEKYQNSTLRYTPPKDFPKYYADIIGKQKIIRCFLTLDEVWDYRTDKYNWNYDIGVNNYVGDKNHDTYEWGISTPLGTKFLDYINSYAEYADEVLLNIRRYECEGRDGIVSLDKYEEVVEKVIEYYKEACPKITYIECCNEVELYGFGHLTMDEYYKLYKCTYRAVYRLNSKHNYSTPLKVGGFAMSECIDHFNIWYAFLKNLASDTSPEKCIDFYSMHDYSTDIYRIPDFVMRHKEAVKNLGLPDSVILFDEYGSPYCTGNAEDSLKNASIIIPGIIMASHLENFHLFPWCTYHSPKYQLSFTQFYKPDNSSSYAATPNGHALTAFHMLAENEIEIEENVSYKAVATADEKRIVILASNPSDEETDYRISIRGLKGYNAKIKNYLCDSSHNNNLTSSSVNYFWPTYEGYMTSNVHSEGSLSFKMTLEAHAFVLTVIEK